MCYPLFMRASQRKVIPKDDAVILKFTKGAKEQIEELKAFYKTDTELDLIKLGISILQNFKNAKEKLHVKQG